MPLSAGCIDAYKLDSSSRYACQIGCGQTESSVLITTATPVATGVCLSAVITADVFTFNLKTLLYW